MPAVSTALIKPAANSTTGIQFNVSADVYHADMRLGLVSKSGLDKVKRSPAHYKAWVEGRAVGKTTPALAFGTATHMALLEPERFIETYAIEPKFGDLRRKENSAAKDRWLEENIGRTPISADDHARISAMGESVMRHPAASKLISSGHAEVTLRWEDQGTGLACKARADRWIEELQLVVDLKTTDDASPEAFARSVYNYRYHVQDALYRDGFAECGYPVQHFAIVAVEKEPPFAVAVYTLDANAVARGYADARANIETLAECVRTDQWHGYSNGVEELSLPRWAS